MSSAENEDAPVKPKRAAPAKDVSKTEKQGKCKKCCWYSFCLSDTCIQVTAWLLFTAGLCIIASTVYVSIVLQANRERHVDFNDTYEIDNVTEYTEAIVEMTTASFNKSVKTLSLPIANTPEYRNGCREINCRITCMDATRFYDMLYTTFSATSCSYFDVLLVREQHFVNGVLRNAWIDCQRPVYELVLTESNITRIRSGAFNTPLFAETYLLSLSALQLTRVGSGSLLGLRSLRYLIIDTPLEEINRAFFQPVQSTLMHLRMNCGLNVLPQQSIFGVSTLQKLEYADLSHNAFYAPLTRQMFLATPNLRYLHITNSKITAIDTDAFSDLSGVLEVLDLSENLINTVSSALLKPLLFGSQRTLISLAYNKWNCDCDLMGFANIYQKYRKKFLSSIFCQSPRQHHGKPLHELSFKDDNCATQENSEEYVALATTTSTMTRAITTTPIATTVIAMHKTTPTTLATTTTRKPTISGTTNTPLVDTTLATLNISSDNVLTPIGSDGSSSRSSAEDLSVIQLRCLHIVTSRNQNEEETEAAREKRSLEIAIISSEAKSSAELNVKHSSEESDEGAAVTVEPAQSPSAVPPVTRHPRNTSSGSVQFMNATTFPNKHEYHNPPMAYYKFEVPSYNFELTLLENNSVQVFIHDYNSQLKINILWFTRQNDVDYSENVNEVAQNIDYHCEMYQQPYLVVNELNENTTYTFCMLEIPQITISPFNCLPLYVPTLTTEADNTWITQDDKQFTLGMLSLIFVMSALFGGMIAYFGVKTYPELLEGSKNVLVVKRSEQASEYLSSMGSIKKEPLSRRSTKKLTLCASEMPPMSLPPPPPFCVSNSNLERLSSIKSSSTLFESSFGPPPFCAVDDQYELPKQYNRSFEEERSVPNPYAMSPCSPPPLPKRNPSITSSIVTNRFSKVN